MGKRWESEGSPRRKGMGGREEWEGVGREESGVGRGWKGGEGERMKKR